MRTSARFPAVDAGAGHYESFYLKATRPGGGQAIWIRHTIHKPPGEARTGSIWLTFFDADAPGPAAIKVTVSGERSSEPVNAWIEVGPARMGPGSAIGEARTDALEASWELRFDEGREPFHHLPRPSLYRTRLP